MAAPRQVSEKEREILQNFFVDTLRAIGVSSKPLLQPGTRVLDPVPLGRGKQGETSREKLDYLVGGFINPLMSQPPLQTSSWEGDNNGGNPQKPTY